MKLNEMKQNFNTNHRVENSISNWGDVCKTIYEDHQDIVKKKCEKVYSHSGYMDKEDIMQDVICNSVDQFQKRKRLGADLHSTTGEKMDSRFLFRKCIEAGTTDFIKSDSTIKDKPHMRIEGTNYLSQVVVIDNPFSQSSGNSQGDATEMTWKDIIPDESLKEPIDKLIYEEYIDDLINSIQDFEYNKIPLKLKSYHKRSKVNLKELAKMLLAETPVKEIKVKLGVNDACISKARRNILLPLALMVIDEPLFYKKYENILSDRAKKVISSKKDVAF